MVRTGQPLTHRVLEASRQTTAAAAAADCCNEGIISTGRRSTNEATEKGVIGPRLSCTIASR